MGNKSEPIEKGTLSQLLSVLESIQHGEYVIRLYKPRTNGDECHWKIESTMYACDCDGCLDKRYHLPDNVQSDVIIGQAGGLIEDKIRIYGS